MKRSDSGTLAAVTANDNHSHIPSRHLPISIFQDSIRALEHSALSRRQTMDIKEHIRRIPDFPKPGILFYDISTLLAHAAAWQETMTRLATEVSERKPDLLVGIESRGFLVAAPLALKLGLGFVMARKKGKLPGRTVRYDYALEYGTDSIEMQEDAIQPGQKVVILDDLLATGGTLAATIALARRMGAHVSGAACIIELGFLGGRARIDVPVSSLVSFES